MSPNDAAPKPVGIFLVVYSDYVVAGDIAETIKELIPEADVIVKSHISEIGAALAITEKIDVAFIEAGPEIMTASGLANEIARRRGRVVLLGDAAETAEASKSWQVLARPFSSDDVRAYLALQTDC